MTRFSPRLRAEELEDLLLLEQGFYKIAHLSRETLPADVAVHREISGLGDGTFVLAALSCYRNEPADLSAPGDPHALIAPFARRHFYAEAVWRLKAVVRTLCRRYGLGKQAFRIFCNSRLPEKALAAASGLGTAGKNSLILIPGLGSLFIIAGFFLPMRVDGRGEAVLSEPDPASDAVAAVPHPATAATTEPGPASDPFPLCGSCSACQDSCPVQALSTAGRLDRSRCLQSLCTEPAPLSQSSRLAWGFRFYGCQSCQDVCPHNGSLSVETPTRRGELGPSLSLRRLLSLSVEQIGELIRGSALDRSWIPPQTLLRNALLAAGNCSDPALSDLVARHRSSPDPLLARAADWALERLDD